MNQDFKYCKTCKMCKCESSFYRCKLCDEINILCVKCVKSYNVLNDENKQFVLCICNDCLKIDYDKLIDILKEYRFDTNKDYFKEKLMDMIKNVPDEITEIQERIKEIEKEVNNLSYEKLKLSRKIEILQNHN